MYPSITQADEGDDIFFGWKQNYLVMLLIAEMKGFYGLHPPPPYVFFSNPREIRQRTNSVL